MFERLCLWSLSALLLVAVVGLGIMILLLAAVCVLLTNMKCRRKKKGRHAGRWLDIWKTTDVVNYYYVFLIKHLLRFNNVKKKSP